MRAALAIARKELTGYFATPVAWVMFAVVAFFGALFFNGGLDAYRFLSLRAMQFQNPGALEHLNLTERVVSPLFGSLAVLWIFVAPFFSARLFAEEKRSRTFELLLTCPVRPAALVAGKYLAALAVMALSLGLVALFPAILTWASRGSSGGAGVEWQTVATGLIGLGLYGAMSLAVGMAISTFTESVLVAGLVTWIVLIVLWVLGILTVGVEGPLREITAALSASDHLTSFLAGRLELKDIAYYPSWTLLALFVTDRAVEGHRWG